MVSAESRSAPENDSPTSTRRITRRNSPASSPDPRSAILETAPGNDSPADSATASSSMTLGNSSINRCALASAARRS